MKCLETFLIVTIAECYWQLIDKPEIQLKIYNAQGNSPQEKVIWTQISIVPRIRIPDLCLCLDNILFRIDSWDQDYLEFQNQVFILQKNR